MDRQLRCCNAFGDLVLLNPSPRLNITGQSIEQPRRRFQLCLRISWGYPDPIRPQTSARGEQWTVENEFRSRNHNNYPLCNAQGGWWVNGMIIIIIQCPIWLAVIWPLQSQSHRAPRYGQSLYYCDYDYGLNHIGMGQMGWHERTNGFMSVWATMAPMAVSFKFLLWSWTTTSDWIVLRLLPTCEIILGLEGAVWWRN